MTPTPARTPRHVLLIAATSALVATPAARAVEFEHSGFASLVAGRSYGACTRDVAIAEPFASRCSRFIADWAHAGVYTDHASLAPESRIGVQATAQFNERWSATGQVVLRSNEAARAALEWAYLTWKPAAEWTFFAGRKRLPLFNFSEYQDVGYAYTWLRPPPDVYGWDVVNYNGASARWQTALGGGWNVKADVFAGGENSTDNAYSRLYYTDQPKAVKWSRLRGTALEFSRGWFSGRAVWIESDYRQRDQQTDTLDVLGSGNTTGKQRITGLSLAADADPLLVQAEYSVFDRNDFQYKARAWMVAAGWRFGKWTPMVTASGYGETSPFADYAPLVMRSQALTLRYELRDNVALKLQLDRYRERSTAGLFTGSSRALSVGLDTVF